MSDEALLKLLRTRSVGALATLMPDGRPQLSTIVYGVDEDGSTVRISVTDDRVKTRNLRRDPRAALYVNSEDGWSWVVAEGIAELSPVATGPQDGTVRELIELYRSIRGEEHPDWDDYRRAMVAERRLVVRLVVRRLYGG